MVAHNSGVRMVYKYSWPQMNGLEGPLSYDVQTSGNLSPGAATRMRMVALSPRRSLRRAAGRLSTQGYSSRQRTQFDVQALEKELMPGFAGYFADKVYRTGAQVALVLCSVWSCPCFSGDEVGTGDAPR